MTTKGKPCARYKAGIYFNKIDLTLLVSLSVDSEGDNKFEDCQ
jgi:hypothetical protein